MPATKTESGLWAASSANALASSPRVKAVTLSKNPVGYWRLDETSGLVAKDSSANGHDGAVTGGVTLGAPLGLPGDPADAGMTFNGSTGWVSVPESAGLRLAGDLTIHAWIVLSASETGQGGVLSKFFNTNGNRSYRLGVNGTSKALGFANSNDGTAAASVGSTGRVTAGVLTRVAAVFHAAAGSCDFYINALLDSTKTGLFTSNFTANVALPVGIGSWDPSATGSNLFWGSLKDVSLFGYALSPGDMSDLYLAGASALGAVVTTKEALV